MDITNVIKNCKNTRYRVPLLLISFHKMFAQNNNYPFSQNLILDINGLIFFNIIYVDEPFLLLL